MTTFAGVLVKNIWPGGQIKPTLLDAGPVYVASTGRNSPFVMADVVCMDVFFCSHDKLFARLVAFLRLCEMNRRVFEKRVTCVSFSL